MAAGRFDAIIVGGGIGGAVLALFLARAGRKTLILEREKTPPVSGRPELLAQATLDVFRRIGAGERVLEEAAWPVRGLEARDAGDKLLIRFDADDFRQAGFQPYTTDPAGVRRILMDCAAKEDGLEVMRGVRMRSLIESDGRVRGVVAEKDGQTIAYEADFVAGDDGGRSAVRDALGLSIGLREFPLRFLVPRRFLPVADSNGFGQARLDVSAMRSGVAAGIFFPVRGEDTAFVFGMTREAHEIFKTSPSLFYERALSMSPGFARKAVVHFRFPDDYLLLERPFGHASSYTARGAAILGDAAHPVTPAGGQGANMSVHDAVALAEALRSGRLESYEAERRPANARSVAISARAAWVLRRPFLIRPVLSLVPRVKTRLIRAISTTFLPAR